jgi:DNA-binding winged helix-turn-helix (wHTH) protein/RecA/RadA recombinase
VVHAFEDCELDAGAFLLRRSGAELKLEPKVFDVLAYLLKHRERVVTKSELLDALWPGEALSESVLPRAIAAARRAVGDTRERARVIETVHGRGYRFVAKVIERATASPARSVAVSPAPDRGERFVGRAELIARLDEAVGAACGGRGRVLLIAGEPGIGKTRVCEEVARSANARGLSVATGRCLESEGAPPLWPWRQLLRTLLADPRALALDAASELAPSAGAPEQADEHARFRWLDALARFVRALAAEQPLLLVLEDLHWADDASLLALRFLASEIGEARALLLATYRDVDVRRSHPLARTLGALARERSCERVQLRGLDAAAVSALVEAQLGDDASPELARTIFEMTEGNPFFVKEIARVVSKLPPRDGRAALALPQSVRDAIGRRLEALSPHANEQLRAAAVLGRAFDSALLARITDAPAEAVLDSLGEALDAGVLRESEERIAHYTFAHALIRQTLYEELRAPQRVRLHQRAAEALADLTPTGAEAPLAEIAHHAFEALPGGGAVLALDAAVRAARAARASLAFEESARLYEQALEAHALAAPRDGERRFELLASAGEAHSAGGARNAARDQFQRAAAIARELARPDLLARAALGARGYGEMGVPPERATLALLEEARDAIGAHEPMLRARLLAKLAGTPPYSLSMATRDELSREALALAQASGDATAQSDALGARHWACFGPDRVRERFDVGTALIELGNRTANPLATFSGYEAHFGAHLAQGDSDGADRALAECGRIAEASRYRFLLFQARYFEAARVACAGDLPRAESLLGAARAVARDHIVYAPLQCDAHSLWISLQSGKRDAARAAGAELLPRIAGSWLGAELTARCAAALLALGEGRAAPARGVLAELGPTGIGGLERNEHFLLVCSTLTDLAFRLRDRDAAAALARVLTPYTHLSAFHDLLRTFAGSVSSLLGELALTLARYDEAVAHYEAGIAHETRAGARAALVSSRVMLARTLRKRRRAGDARRASELLARAAKEAPQLGIDWTERFNFDAGTLEELPRPLA